MALGPHRAGRADRRPAAGRAPHLRPPAMTFGCVVLTRGDRPDALAAALASLQRQEGVELDIVVVGNGWEPTGLPEGVRGHFEPEDRGIPAGRNAGVPHVAGELLFFLDDDATLVENDALAYLARELSTPGNGAMSCGLAQL